METTVFIPDPSNILIVLSMMEDRDPTAHSDSLGTLEAAKTPLDEDEEDEDVDEDDDDLVDDEDEDDLDDDDLEDDDDEDLDDDEDEDEDEDDLDDDDDPKPLRVKTRM